MDDLPEVREEPILVTLLLVGVIMGANPRPNIWSCGLNMLHS